MAIIINSETKGVYLKDSAYHYDGDILSLDDPSGIIIDIPGKFYVSGNVAASYGIEVRCNELHARSVHSSDFLTAFGSVIAENEIYAHRDITVAKLLSAPQYIYATNGDITAGAIVTEGPLEAGETRTNGIKNSDWGDITADRIGARYGIRAMGTLSVRRDVIACGNVMMNCCRVCGPIRTHGSVVVFRGDVSSCSEVRAPKVVLCNIDIL